MVVKWQTREMALFYEPLIVLLLALWFSVFVDEK